MPKELETILADELTFEMFEEKEVEELPCEDIEELLDEVGTWEVML